MANLRDLPVKIETQDHYNTPHWIYDSETKPSTESTEEPQ